MVKVRVRVRNVSFPSGMKLCTCKNLPMKIGPPFPSIFGREHTSLGSMWLFVWPKVIVQVFQIQECA